MKGCLLIVLSFISLVAFSQPGEVDLTFNTADKGNGYGEGAGGPVGAVLALPDGKVLMAGGLNSYHGFTTYRVARANADGTVDESFKFRVIDYTVKALARDADGKYLVGGDFTNYDGKAVAGIMRINSDGTLDNTFNNGTSSGAATPGSTGVTCIIVQADGKIMIGGNFNSYNTVSRKGIARLNADGTLDTSFDPGTGITETGGVAGLVRAIRQDANGKTVAVGRFINFNSNAVKNIVRLNTNGSYDNTLVTGTGPNNTVNTIDFQADGKIFIGGLFTQYNGTARNRIALIDATGTLQTSFQPLDASDNEITALKVLSDGKIAIAGLFTSWETIGRTKFAVINANGTISSTLQTGVGLASNAGSAVNVACFAITTDNKFILGGSFSLYQNKPAGNIVRVAANGDYDATFAVPAGGGPIFGEVKRTILQADGKIIVAGNFVFYDGVSRNRIARINADGTLDNSFNPGTGANDMIYAAALQSDGKILIGGSFTNYNGVAVSRICRLNTDGTLDNTFTASINITVVDIAVQADQKVVAVGAFTVVNTLSRKGIVRLNTNGTTDNTFVGVSDDTALVVAIQADQKVIVGGNFLTLNGMSRAYLGRLNTDGSTDTNFNTLNTTNGSVQAIAVLSSGKIAIGGEYTKYNNVDRRAIAVINADFSLDTSFAPTTGSLTAGTTVINAIKPDGDKLVVGGFMTFDLSASRKWNNMARFNANGTLDETFAPVSGASSRIVTITRMTDGKYLVGGLFTNINGVGRNYLARIYDKCAGNVTAEKPTIAASDDHLCVKEAVKLTLTGTLPTQAAWKWYKGTLDSTPVGSGTFIDTAAGEIAGATTYLARAEGGCVTPGDAASFAITAIKPVVTSTSATRCGDGNVTLTAMTTSGVISWIWRQDEKVKGTGPTFTVEVRSFDTYYVQADDGGCISDRATSTAEALSGGFINLASQQGVLKLGEFSSPVSDFKSFQWETCEGEKIAGATSSTYTPTKSGSYRISAINKNDCPTTSTCASVTVTTPVVTGLEDSGLFATYPNPSNGTFNIDLGTEVYSSIVIHDMNGKLFYSESGILMGSKNIRLNASRGLYVVTLTGNTTKKLKILVE